MENLRIKVVEVVSMTERVEATTADGKYCMSGERVTNNGNVTDFGGGGVIRVEDGTEVARVQACHRDTGMTVQYNRGYDFGEISSALQDLTEAIMDREAPDEAKVAEEGGEA